MRMPPKRRKPPKKKKGMPPKFGYHFNDCYGNTQFEGTSFVLSNAVIEKLQKMLTQEQVCVEDILRLDECLQNLSYETSYVFSKEGQTRGIFDSSRTEARLMLFSHLLREATTRSLAIEVLKADDFRRLFFYFNEAPTRDFLVSWNELETSEKISFLEKLQFIYCENRQPFGGKKHPLELTEFERQNVAFFASDTFSLLTSPCHETLGALLDDANLPVLLRASLGFISSSYQEKLGLKDASEESILKRIAELEPASVIAEEPSENNLAPIVPTQNRRGRFARFFCCCCPLPETEILPPPSRQPQ